MSKTNPLFAAIEQLEAERAILDTTIAYLRAKAGLSEPGKSLARPAAHAPTTTPPAIDSDGEIRSDAFFGMKAPKAVIAYLEMVKKPKPGAEITRALVGHGYTTASATPANSIRTALGRLERSGEVVQVNKKDWGLAKWYPGFKNRRPKTEEVAEQEDNDEGR